MYISSCPSHGLLDLQHERVIVDNIVNASVANMHLGGVL